MTRTQLRRALRLVVIVATLAVAGWNLIVRDGASPGNASPAALPSTAAQSPALAPSPAIATTPTSRSSPGFRSPAQLIDHYQRHGTEFGAVDQAEYLALAQALRDRPVGGNVLEIIRDTDGVISRYDRSSGAFLAVNRDRTIRTFFKPNDGEDYFRRQARRRPNP